MSNRAILVIQEKRNGTSRKDCRRVKDVLGGGGLHRMYIAPREGVYKICQLDFVGDWVGKKILKDGYKF